MTRILGLTEFVQSDRTLGRLAQILTMAFVGLAFSKGRLIFSELPRDCADPLLSVGASIALWRTAFSDIAERLSSFLSTRERWGHGGSLPVVPSEATRNTGGAVEGLFGRSV
jgi:hypothetical protein